MVISGLQKMSLVDFPGKVAATVFTGGCDLRCPFCHNFELVTHPTKEMETQELLAFLKKRTGLLDGVCITGGEPCLHKDLPDLMRQIRALGFPVKLDTNGNHPDVLAAVLSEKLADVWERGLASVARQIENVYDEKCRNCDEYYTFNF